MRHKNLFINITMASKKKKFSAEIGKVLKLMIHSLYTNKDIFLRELISNASDACDKLRYESLSNPSIAHNEELKIKISTNKEAGTLTITDNGIGMNEQDLINNLGTIASSGTQKYIEQISQTNKPDLNLIGQFGVGFYSAFMVADEVTVISKKAGEAQGYKWKSDGQSDYTVTEETDAPNGTSITLKIKDSEVDFLDKFRLRHIITTYSDHISFPIELEGEVVNTASALWIRNKNEITDEQYNEFYHHVAHLPDTPWLRMHNKVEGNIEYTSLLYIPSTKPFDLFHPDRTTRVKLYVKRVFITDEGVSLIPQYLRFMRGVVDSEDLPLNISRETLQNNSVLEKIKKSLVKKVLSELKTKAKEEKEEYSKFWKNFGEVMKEGLCEGALEEKESLLEVCRFYSNKLTDNEFIGLDDYIERMAEGQNQIFFLTGDNIEALRKHPHLEGFNKRDIEVLLLADHVDDFWVNVVNQYKNYEFTSVSSSSYDLDTIKKVDKQEKEKSEANNDNEKDVLDYIKNIVGSKVKDVRPSTKLVDSPACLSVPEGGMSIRMERYLIDQKQLKNASAKILEINMTHPIISKIAADLKNNVANDDTSDLAQIIYDQACVIEGEPLSDVSAFTAKMNKFIARAV